MLRRKFSRLSDTLASLRDDSMNTLRKKDDMIEELERQLGGSRVLQLDIQPGLGPEEVGGDGGEIMAGQFVGTTEGKIRPGDRQATQVGSEPIFLQADERGEAM
jgi:hypothetical protein